jgi:Sec-independent protein secretion pathway component TatC
MNSALFSVSINEIVLVAVVALVAYAIARRTEQHWLLGVPAMLAALSAVTPADPVSTLLTGIPVSTIYVFAFLRAERRVPDSRSA